MDLSNFQSAIYRTSWIQKRLGDFVTGFAARSSLCDKSPLNSLAVLSVRRLMAHTRLCVCCLRLTRRVCQNSGTRWGCPCSRRKGCTVAVVIKHHLAQDSRLRHRPDHKREGDSSCSACCRTRPVALESSPFQTSLTPNFNRGGVWA